jgi:phosphoribulokinase
MHLKLTRDEDGRPVDSLHVHGYAPREDTQLLKKAIWSGLGGTQEVPSVLGDLGDARHSDPLAVTQLILLHHLTEAAR